MITIKTKYLYLIVGKSGAGKSSVVKALCDRYRFTEVISFTDRKRRLNEGNTHIFTDTKTIESMKNDLVAFTSFSGNLYGVDINAIEQNDLYTIDLNGIKFFHSHYKGNKPYKIIYINTPESDCHMRMITRGDSHIDIAKRLANDKTAFKDADKIADYIVKNDFFGTCVDNIYKYICKCEGWITTKGSDVD